MNILLNGCLGYMGKEVTALSERGYRGAKLLFGVDPTADGADARIYKSLCDLPCTDDVDCIIDFSHHTATPELLGFARERRLPVVLATTGHTEDEIGEIKKAASDIPIFYSGNMSLGIALLIELAKNVAAAMPEAEIEIVETHHNRKIDAPSGTALMIANAISEVRTDTYTNLGRSGHGKRAPEEIGIHSVRMGNIVGIHEVIVGTKNQTITLKHEAHSRALFAEGALDAASFLTGMSAGIYDMRSIVSDEESDVSTVIG